MNRLTKSTALLGLAVLLASAGTVAAQVTVPASFAHPKSDANTNAKGFRVRTVQANTASGTLQNNVSRAEAQLAGTLIDPMTNKPYVNDADLTSFGADGFYNETTVIDYEQGGGSASGLGIPGIPGKNDNRDNIAIEVLTYLDLPAGEQTMTINSDDGFRVTVGPDARDRASEIELGVFDSGRAAADTTFKFTIAQAGVYSFRLVWFEGTGGANVSWYSEGDTKVLINDPNVPTSIKAYRELTTPTAPYVQILNPTAFAQNVLPNTTVNATIVDSATVQVLPASIQLFFDETKIAITPTKDGGKTTFSYDPPGLLQPLSVHKVKLIFADSANNSRTTEYQFTTAEFSNINLPAPFFFENFDSVKEGSIPAGWTVQNFSDGDDTPDLDDPKSGSYKDWVVISRQRVIDLAAAGKWEIRRLNTQAQFVNGEEVKQLVNGNFIYAESDTRSGNQVQYLFTKDIDCTGKNNVFVSFHNIYEQNQDSIGAVEYSIDKGATWLPIAYYIDTADLIKDAKGNIDAAATLLEPRGDTAKYTDPVTGEDKGGFYGAFIGVAQDKWSALGPFISGRINDDPTESKRVELYRLPQADNQATVRLRFAQAGTASWYFGIDDLGLYSITQIQPPKIVAAPQSQSASVGATVTFSVTATGDSLSYQWKFNGTDIQGATGSTYKIDNVQAANAGDYSVVVTNPAGPVPSAAAKLKVFAGAITQDLVAHLQFDNNLTDSSGRNNNGTAVGAPTFSAGKIGPNALHIPSGADYVTLGTPGDLNFGTGTDFSIAFWTKVAAWTEDPSFIGNKDWNAGGNPGYVLAADGDGHFQWNLSGPPGTRKDYDGPPGLFKNADQTWHHIVVTFDRAGNAITFVDGTQTDARPLTANQNNLDTPTGKATNIGQDGTGTYGPAFTDADVDDLGIWRRVLTPQEVAAIYNTGLKGQDLTKAQATAPAVAPAITAQPASRTLFVGDNATFSVTATGTPPLTYQWKLNGTDIAGATSASLTVPNLAKANAGAYTVVVSNGGGSAPSSPANLTVNDIPVAANITDGLAVHLKFDGDYKDSSGNNVNGTAVGAPTIGTGKIGSGALVYTTKKDGSSFNYVTLGNPAQLNFANNKDFTVSFWGKLGTWEGDPAFIANKDWGSGGNIGWVAATAGDGHFQWNYRETAGAPRKDYDGPAGLFSDKNWHHIVVSFTRGGAGRTYVDGQLVSSADIAPNTGTLESGLAVNIGQDGKGTYTDGNSVSVTNGMIDDVAIWTRTLAPAEVTAIYTKGQVGQSFDSPPPATVPGKPEDNGLAGKTATFYINTPDTLNNGNTESLGVAIASNGNVMVGWEDDGDALKDLEAVWTMFDGAGKSITPDTKITTLNPDFAGQTLTSKFLSYFRADKSAVAGRTSWGPKIHANLFGDGLGMGATSFELGLEVAELAAINVDAGGGGDFPSVQLLTNDGQPSGIVTGVSDADAEPEGDIRIADWEYLANGNIVVAGESRQKDDLVSKYGGSTAANHAIYRIVAKNGTEVKATALVSGTPDGNEIWHGAGVTKDGFAIRFAQGGRAIVRLFNNSGAPVGGNLDLGTVAKDEAAAGGGRGDGTGFHGNGNDAYVAVNGAGAQVRLTVLNADGTLRYSRSATDLPLKSVGRNDAAISPSGQVLVVFSATYDGGPVTDEGTDIPVVMGRLFDASGNPLGGTFYVSEKEVPTAKPLQAQNPRVAWRGTTAAVVWQSKNSGQLVDGNPVEVVAARLFTVGAPAPPLHIASIKADAAAVTINWTGGDGPFLVQGAIDVAGPWIDLVTTADRSTTQAYLTPTGFFRVVDKTTKTVKQYRAVLTGAAERPNPVNTPATGIANVSLDGNKLSYVVVYGGLSGSATAGHFHGPASASEAAGVLQAFETLTPLGTAGVFGAVGVQISDALKTAIETGKSYANIHTAANGGGEIRGQVVPAAFHVTLNGASERPNPVTTTATGTGTLTLVGNQLIYNISYTGLSAAATAGHIHGPGTPEEAKGVLIGFPNVSGTSGTLTGTLTLDAPTLEALLSSLTYANIHTSTNPGGEIRGQILP